MISGFGTYIYNKHGDDVLTCLNDEARDRAISSEWDDANRCAISQEDKELADKQGRQSVLVDRNTAQRHGTEGTARR